MIVVATAERQLAYTPFAVTSLALARSYLALSANSLSLSFSSAFLAVIILAGAPRRGPGKSLKYQ